MSKGAMLNQEYTYEEDPVSVTIVCTAEYEPEEGPTYACAGVPASPAEWDVVSVKCFGVPLCFVPDTPQFYEFLERAMDAAEEYYAEQGYDYDEL